MTGSSPRSSQTIDPPCATCPNSGSWVRYSNWNYCTHPDDFRKFSIVRRRSDFTGALLLTEVPGWCPATTGDNVVKVYPLTLQNSAEQIGHALIPLALELEIMQRYALHDIELMKKHGIDKCTHINPAMACSDLIRLYFALQNREYQMKAYDLEVYQTGNIKLIFEEFQLTLGDTPCFIK